MLRSDGTLLACAIVRRSPTQRAAVRDALRALGPRHTSSLPSLGQSLIRRKLVSPQEFLACRQLVERATHRCAGCGRTFHAWPADHPRTRTCLRCRHTTHLPGQPPPPRQAWADESSLTDDSPPPAKLAAMAPRGTRSTKRYVATISVPPDALGAPLSAETQDLPGSRPPARIGEFEVVSQIGDGGMGVIFRVRDPRGGPDLALKRLRPGTSHDATIRFRREAEALQRLNHPNIIRVHHVGEDPPGRAFYTMDLVDGKDLEHERPHLPRAAFLDILACVAEGLHHAHERGIIHRDIKPPNIIIDAQRHPTVVDFGLARDLGRSSLTEDGDLVGTPLFMAPEQLRGDPTAIDRRTDIYALGVLLFQALTDRLPHDAKSLFELQRKVLEQPAPAPSAYADDVPPALDRVVAKALERHPADRYPTALELAQDLRAFLDGQRVEATRTPTWARWTRRAVATFGSPMGLIALALLAAALTAGGVTLHTLRRQALERDARDALTRRRADCLRLTQDLEDGAHRALERLAAREPHTALELARDLEPLRQRARAALDDLGLDAPPGAASTLQRSSFLAEEAHIGALALLGPDARRTARQRFPALVRERSTEPRIYLAWGELLLRDDAPALALDALNTALGLDDDLADAYALRAEAERQLGQLRFAILDVQRALERQDRLHRAPPARAHLTYARALIALGELPRARKALADAQTNNPTDPLLHVARAELLHADHDPTGALRSLHLAARTSDTDPHDPARTEVLLAHARALIHNGDTPAARARLDDAIARGSLHAHAIRARLHTLLGHDDAARTDLDAALARAHPQHPLWVPLHLTLARHLRSQGHTDRALAALARALPTDAAPTPQHAPVLLEQAELWILRGSNADALDADRALAIARELLPATPRLDLGQAALLLLRRDPDNAGRALRRVLDRDPHHPRALALWAQAHLHVDPSASQQPTRGALARADETFRHLPDPTAPLPLAVDDPSHEALALWSHARRQLAYALRSTPPAADILAITERLRRATRLAPWLAGARVDLARALWARDLPADALRALQPTLEHPLPPSEASALAGRILLAEDRAADARVALTDALQRSTAAPAERVPLWTARALAAQALDQPRLALEDLDRALAHDPKHLPALDLRAHLRAQLDLPGHQDDLRRAQLIRTGYLEVCESARLHALAVRTQTGPAAAAQALDPAAAAVSGAVDPAWADEIDLLRAFYRCRAIRLPEAFLDLASLLQRSAHSFVHLHDEGVGLASDQALDVDRLWRDASSYADAYPHLSDPWLQGFAAYVDHEFGLGTRDLDAAVDLLQTLIRAHPGHDSARLILAELLRGLGRPTDALRATATVLDQPDPPAFAHYVLARLRADLDDTPGALRAVQRAILAPERPFCPPTYLARDTSLRALLQLPAATHLTSLARGAHALRRIDDLERLPRPAPPRDLYTQALQITTAGLDGLAPALEADDPHARALASHLYLARARQQQRTGSARDLARDVSAALEASPHILLEHDSLQAAAHLTHNLPRDFFARATPVRDERFPRSLGPSTPALLSLIARRPLPPEERTTLRAHLTSLLPQRPPLHAYLALLALADDDPDAARDHLAALRQHHTSLAPVALWIEAAAHLTTHPNHPLTLAVDAGLRADLHTLPHLPQPLPPHLRDLARRALDPPPPSW